MTAKKLPLTIGASNSTYPKFFDDKMSYRLSAPMFCSDPDGTHDIFLLTSNPVRCLFPDSARPDLCSIIRSGKAKKIPIVRGSHDYHSDQLPSGFPKAILDLQQDFQTSIYACNFRQDTLRTPPDGTILVLLQERLSQGFLSAAIPDFTVEILLDFTLSFKVAEASVSWTFTMQYFRAPLGASTNWNRRLRLCTKESPSWVMVVDPIIILRPMPPYTTPPSMLAPASSSAGSDVLIQVPPSQILATHTASVPSFFGQFQVYNESQHTPSGFSTITLSDQGTHQGTHHGTQTSYASALPPAAPATSAQPQPLSTNHTLMKLDYAPDDDDTFLHDGTEDFGCQGRDDGGATTSNDDAIDTSANSTYQPGPNVNPPGLFFCPDTRCNHLPFGRKFSMVKHHQSQHLKIRCHHCSYCKRGFVQQSGVNRHIKKKSCPMLKAPARQVSQPRRQG
ncbi:MAG: hypothetical protein J3R72DRAFT_439826 [Linnemannia gamsii]|nr:MAG: hypothetical protein J3R72DRAFT_439826 [Linnemannia gamsii]